MRISRGMVVLLWLGGCRLADDGVLSCKRDSDAYVGMVVLTRSDYPAAVGIPDQSSLSFDGVATYFPSTDAGSLKAYFSGCYASRSDPCCYIAPAPDAGDDSSSLPYLSDWTVTVADESAPDGGTSFEDILTDGGLPGAAILGSLMYVPWTGGDELLAQGNGLGTVDEFSGRIATPRDFEGLSPNLFADGGTVALAEDLPLSWTPGGASSVLIVALDEVTFGQVLCTVPDNGSFTIPSSTLSHFQPGDQAALVVARSAQSCAYSDNASILLLVQTQTIAGVTFQ